MKKPAALALTLILIFSALASCTEGEGGARHSEGEIYLYGTEYGVPEMTDALYEIWKAHYDDGLRHLFIEYSYETAMYLNMWMQSNNDDIFTLLWSEWENSEAANPATLEFFKAVKRNCRETVFHGVDVGINHDSAGARLLAHFENAGMGDSLYSEKTKASIEQGKSYAASGDEDYRTRMLAENFIGEFDALGDLPAAGFFGCDRVNLFAESSMAAALGEVYGIKVYSEDLRLTVEAARPLRSGTVTFGEVDYDASYFGVYENLPLLTDHLYCEVWRIESGLSDFDDMQTQSYGFSSSLLSIPVKTGQVFFINLFTKNGDSEQAVYRVGDRRTDGFHTLGRIVEYDQKSADIYFRLINALISGAESVEDIRASADIRDLEDFRRSYEGFLGTEQRFCFICDINGDGVSELFSIYRDGETDGSRLLIHSIFTITGGRPALVTNRRGDRSVTIGESGDIYIVEQKENGRPESGVYRLKKNSAELVIVYILGTEKDEDGNDRFYSYDGAEKTYMTEESFVDSSIDFQNQTDILGSLIINSRAPAGTD